MSKIVLGGKKVLVSGSLLVPRTDPVELYPFQDDPDFKLSFEFNFVGEDDSQSVKIVDPGDQVDNLMIVRFQTPFRSGEIFANTEPLTFAEDEGLKEDYVGYFASQAFGTIKKHSRIIFYTIYRVKQRSS